MTEPPQDEQPAVIETKDAIDYNDEYKKHLRCPTCNRKSNGLDDFKSLKTGRKTKTCVKCRTSVYKSLKKIMEKPEYIKKKRITQKQQLAIYRDVVSVVGIETLLKALGDNVSLKTSLQSLVHVKKEERKVL
jgi:hypothetical protein